MSIFQPEVDMRSKVPFVVLALFLLLSLACGFSVGATPTPSPVAAGPTQGSASVEEPTDTGAGAGSELIDTVTLAKGVQGDQNEPVDPTEVFCAPGQDDPRGGWDPDAPANTKFSAAWYTVDVGQAAAPNTLIDKTDISTDGSRNIDFTLTTQDVWPRRTPIGSTSW